MAPTELYFSLIQFLLREDDEDKSFISVLLSWIGSVFPLHEHQGHAEADGYIDTLRQTTPAAFTISFLEFLRAESERVIATQCKSESEREGARIATLSPTSSVASSEDASTARVLPTKATIEDCPYDTDFPVLGVSKSNVQSIKPRRRVNPTPMESPLVDSAFVFAKVESSKQSNSSNLRARSLAPMKVDMDALMQRCEKRRSKPMIVEAAKHNERLVPSLIGELQYMFQLLSLGHFTKQQSQVQNAENKLVGCGIDCSLYNNHSTLD